MSRLADLAELKDGWDGPYSKAIHPRAFANYALLVAAFDSRIPTELEPMPSPQGGIRLEWDHGDISYVADLDADGGLFVCSLPLDEADDIERHYPRFDAVTLKRIYEIGRIEAAE